MLPTKHFGFATSAAQSEPEIVTTMSGKGSVSQGTWDLFLQKKIISGHNLRRWKNSTIVGTDFKLAKGLGADHFRISINPGRILDLSGKVYPEGVEFYKEIFDQAGKNKLKLLLCLHHNQVPVGFDWTQKDSWKYWVRLAQILIDHFGDRKEFWGFISLCEPFGILFFDLAVHGFGLSQFGKLTKINLAIDNMVRFQEKLVGFNKPVTYSHAWLPVYPKFVPLVDEAISNAWHEFYNIKLTRRFLSSEVILGIDAYAYQPLGLTTLFTPSEWPSLYRPYKHKVLHPEVGRVAIEQARKAFPEQKLALSEIGFGEPPESDDTRRPEFLDQAFYELEKLTGKISLEYIDVWTLRDNMEWLEGDKLRFGVAKKGSTSVVRKWFLTNS